MRYSLFLVMILAFSCSRSDEELIIAGSGSTVELSFEGVVPSGALLRLDDMYFYFGSNDTTEWVDNLFSYDALSPELLPGKKASIRIPSSQIFLPFPEGWKPEMVPQNLIPYHFALGFNMLTQKMGLTDRYRLEGNAAAAIMGAGIRIRHIQGKQMRVYRSPDLKIKVETIE